MNRPPRFVCVSLALVLALTWLGVRPAQAQYASEFTQIANMEFLKSQTDKLNKQYVKLDAQLTTLQEQYKQMNLGSFSLSGVTGYRDNNPEFKTRPENFGSERCGLGKSSVADDQQKLCNQIVLMENKRFNVMAEMLNDVRKRDEEIKRLLADRESLPADLGKGRLDANSNAASALQAQMENDIQNAKQLLEAYDVVLKALNDEMVLLAQSALKNKEKQGGLIKRVIGQVAPGATLRAALKGAEQRKL